MLNVFFKHYEQYYSSVDYTTDEVIDQNIKEDEIYYKIKEFESLGECMDFVQREISSQEANMPISNIGTVTNIVYKYCA
jgi:hypothetical protein